MNQAEENPSPDSAPAASSAARGGAARMSQLNHAGRQALGRKAAAARWGKDKSRDQGLGIGEQEKPGAGDLASFAGTAGIINKTHKRTRSVSAPHHPNKQKSLAGGPGAASRRPAPKEFRGAHAYAEKRLAQAIQERAQAMHKLAMLEAEIPSLVGIINALKNSSGRAGGVTAAESVTRELDLGLTAARLPLLRRAQGGAGLPGIGNPVDAAEDEDVFLRESPVAAGEWH
jgi:hypothetical protein